MGRLDVHIRHGSGGNGAGVALLLIAAAVAAGVARAVFHVIAVALEVIVWTVAGAVMAAGVAGGVLAGLRIRHAVHAARARRDAVPQRVVTITPEGYVRPVPADRERPAIDPPRPAGSWPLPGWWQEIRPRIGGDGDDTHPR